MNIVKTNTQKQEKTEEIGLYAHEHGSAPDTNNSNYICERVEETPFHLVGEYLNCAITLGNLRLNIENMTYNECKMWIEEVTWDKILLLITACIEMRERQIEDEENIR